MYLKEIKFLEKIVKQAYKKCIKNKTKNVEVKNNQMFSCDYVTTCDLQTEKFITSKIKKFYPNDNIVSEEFNSQNKMQGRCWILDPIDGTVCFANDIPIWCIQSAFVVDGQTKGAVIFCPELNEIYVATENGLTINGKKAKPINNKPILESLVNFSDLAQKDEQVYKMQLNTIDKIATKTHRIKMMGSAGYEFCMVAKGRTQAYVAFLNNPWDIIPGVYICEKAGVSILKTEYNNTKVTIACTKNLVEPFKEIFKLN